MILSSFTIPVSQSEPINEPAPPPLVENKRVKTIWSTEDIPGYQELLADNLTELRDRWLNPESRTSVSILLDLTSKILKNAAASTNKTIDLAAPKLEKSLRIPKSVKKSQVLLMKNNKRYREALKNRDMFTVEKAQNELKVEKLRHRKLVRIFQSNENLKRDNELYSFLSDATSIQRSIKSSKASKTKDIQHLKVGEKEFHGDHVKTGFYESISNLKMRGTKATIDHGNDQENDVNEDYENILDLCRNKKDIPNISFEDSSKILNKMKQQVNDYFSITTLHYINAGHAGVEHFHFLMNCIIDDVNNASIEELNTVYALLLHKGHGKLKTLSSAYRTISTCPLVSKALDICIRDLNIDKWKDQQALTQYQWGLALMNLQHCSLQK